MVVMPTGVVQWFDPDAGEGRLMGSGRRFAVRADAIEPKARYAGARVHFDIDHDAAGDVATRVVLREGTRVSPRQRRFGDLVGARRFDTKSAAVTTRSAGVHDAGVHPHLVAERWARAMADGAIDDAARLYSPTAVLHAGGAVATGPAAIRRHLDTLLPAGTALEDISGDGDAVRIRWAVADLSHGRLESHLVIEHGEIVEQWQGAVYPMVDVTTGLGPVEMSVEGDVSAGDRAYALDKLAKVVELIGEPVLHLSVRLETLADPARERRFRARATFDIDGEPIRAHMSGHTMTEAIDLLEDRLAARARQRASHRRALRRRGTGGQIGEWRHGDYRAPAPRGPQIPMDERAVVRRPTWSAEASTFDEAVFDLETLDLEFLLFTDLASGLDAVVHRRPRGTYAVRLAEAPGDELRTASTAAIEFDPVPTPHISIDEARERLDAAHESWLFFVEPTSGRGHVLYRRDDGHDGLITPRISVRPPASV